MPNLRGRLVSDHFVPDLPLDLQSNVKFYENFLAGLQGTVAVGSFPFDTIVTTDVEATSAQLAQVYDASDDYYTLATSGGAAGYTANYQLFPDTEALNDAAYFGMESKFAVIYFNVSATVATYADDACKWQYWNGSAWTDLTILYDGTDSDANDGKRPFQADGYLIFSPPSDWARTSVNTKDAYWIRSIVTAAQMTQSPVLDGSTYHQSVASTYPIQVPGKGTIGRARLTWGTNSGANNDTKLILVNLTQQTVSAIKTHTKAKQTFVIADFALAVEEDDEIALFVTQEDGTTEFADGLVEFRLAREAA